MTRLVWTLPDGQQTARWAEDEGGGGGAAQPQTMTETVTTDSDTFVVEHVFDLGHPTVVYWSAEITGQVGDGETFGMAPGELHGDSSLNQYSHDAVTWKNVDTAANPYLHDTPTGSIGDIFDMSFPTARYIKLGFSVYDSDFNVYAGPNNPTVTFQIDVEYL